MIVQHDFGNYNVMLKYKQAYICSLCLFLELLQSVCGHFKALHVSVPS